MPLCTLFFSEYTFCVFYGANQCDKKQLRYKLYNDLKKKRMIILLKGCTWVPHALCGHFLVTHAQFETPGVNDGGHTYFINLKPLHHQNLSRSCRRTMRSRQVGVNTVDVPLLPSWTAPGPGALNRFKCVLDENTVYLQYAFYTLVWIYWLSF